MYPVRLVPVGEMRPADEVALEWQRREDERQERPDEVRAMGTPEVGGRGPRRMTCVATMAMNGDDDSVVERPGGLFW